MHRSREALCGREAVDGLDLDVKRGECFGLLGPNGVGKTTTIEILEGLNTADDGVVRVLGLTLGENERELRQRIGLSLQGTQFSDKLSVLETLRLFRSFYKSGPTAHSTSLQRQIGEQLLRDAHVKELGSRYIDFLVPGLLGDEPDGTGMWGIGFSMDTARLKKLLKRLVAPLTALNDALRAVMNDGYGIAQVAPQLLILAAWATSAYLIGLKIFRWQ